MKLGLALLSFFLLVLLLVLPFVLHVKLYAVWIAGMGGTAAFQAGSRFTADWLSDRKSKREWRKFLQEYETCMSHGGHDERRK